MDIYIYDILYSYSKVRTSSIFKKIIREIHYITVLYSPKKSAAKWTHTIQTRVIQGSTAIKTRVL